MEVHYVKEEPMYSSGNRLLCESIPYDIRTVKRFSILSDR
jgi:hypothetical protein